MINSHFVNLWQTKEERMGKYHLCRDLGANSYQAARMMDWRLSKIERLFHLATTNKQKPVIDRIAQLLSMLPLYHTDEKPDPSLNPTPGQEGG